MQQISPDIFKTITDAAAAHPVMATAAATGLLGGAMTMGTPRRTGETPGGRRLRILRNALLAAGAGGGALALGQETMKNLSTAVPAGDMDPVERKFTSPIGRGMMGLAGLAGAHNYFGRKDDYAAAQKDLGSALSNPGSLAVPGTKGHLPDDVVQTLANDRGPGLTGAMMNGPQGKNFFEALQNQRYAEGRAPFGEDLLHKLHLGSAERELYAAGLPLPPIADDVKGVERGVQHGGRFLAKYLAKLLSPVNARLSRGATKRLPPALRTALGLGGLMAPEIFGSTVRTAKDYLAQPQ